jgi:hypothetical protein
MRPALIIFYTIFFYSVVFAQNATNCQEQNSFEGYLRCVIEDHSKDSKQYPKPPFLTDSLIAEVQREFELHDSTRYFLNNFSYYQQRFVPHREQPEQSLNYFFRKDCFYTLLALTAHWNPDTRIYATRELQKLIRVSMVRNDQKLKTGMRAKEYRSAKEFLIYVLENTPWAISGSENATIHDLYIQAILNCMYLLFGERPPYNDSQVYNFTDKEIENNINRWKEQLKE